MKNITKIKASDIDFDNEEMCSENAGKIVEISVGELVINKLQGIR